MTQEPVTQDLVPAVSRPPRRQRRPRWLRLVEVALWAGGGLAIAWVAWGWLDARLWQQRQERLLEATLSDSPSANGEATRSDANAADREGEPTGIPSDELPGNEPTATSTADVPTGVAPMDAHPGEAPPLPRGARRDAPLPTSARIARAAAAMGFDALGRITVPRLHLAVMVADGVDNQTLRRAVGHIPGTARVGSAGNVGIAGHRDGFFRPLKDVRAGDEVVLTTPGAVTRYRVEWAEVVPPEDTAPLQPTPYPALTLVTCHPFYYMGTAPDRFVVRARLIESRAATAADAATTFGAGSGR